MCDVDIIAAVESVSLGLVHIYWFFLFEFMAFSETLITC